MDSRKASVIMSQSSLKGASSEAVFREAIRKKVIMIGQSQVLDFVGQIKDGAAKSKLFEQLSSLDFDSLEGAFQSAMKNKHNILEVEPLRAPGSALENEESQSAEVLETYRTLGLSLISKNSVGAIAFVDEYKGTPAGAFQPGLLSKKSLFQLQAERILRLQELSKVCGKRGIIPWYVMVNPINEGAIRELFMDERYFGLREENVMFGEQPVVPIFTTQGKIMLETQSSIFLMPDGSGGVFEGLQRSNLYEDMKKRQIEYIFAYRVDNILVKIADPVFIGYVATKNADYGVKVVRRERPEENVDILCSINGRITTIDRLQVSKSIRYSVNFSDELMFDKIDICNHVISINVLKSVIEDNKANLPWYSITCKQMTVDRKTNQPVEANASCVKRFVFDAFPLSQIFVMWQVPRFRHYSEIDPSLESQNQLDEFYGANKFRVEQLGGHVDGDKIEISPLLCYSSEGLEDVVKDKTYKDGTCLNALDEKNKRSKPRGKKSSKIKM